MLSSDGCQARLPCVRCARSAQRAVNSLAGSAWQLVCGLGCWYSSLGFSHPQDREGLQCTGIFPSRERGPWLVAGLLQSSGHLRFCSVWVTWESNTEQEFSPTAALGPGSGPVLCRSGSLANWGTGRGSVCGRETAAEVVDSLLVPESLLLTLDQAAYAACLGLVMGWAPLTRET